MVVCWPEIATSGRPSQMLVWRSRLVRQPLDALGRERGQSIADAVAADQAIRRDLGERHQNEGALEQARMRQRQLRLVDPDVVIGDQIEIERTRAPAPLTGAVAAEFLL